MPAFRPAVLIAGITLLLAAPHADAAPQILALLKTDGPVPLDCYDGTCSGEFSGFCLQRERPDPNPGAQYSAEGGDLTLIVTDASGAVRRVPSGDWLSIETRRSYTAVRIGVPQSLLEEWNAVSIAVEVGERVALVPRRDTADPDPQTEADIALALGPQRALGDRILESSPTETGAVRLTSRMIGALPRGRTDGPTRNGLWDRVVAPAAASYPPEAVSRASAVYRRCLAKVEKGSFYSLRHCLEVGHDSLMIDLNIKYWEAGPEG